MVNTLSVLDEIAKDSAFASPRSPDVFASPRSPTDPQVANALTIKRNLLSPNKRIGLGGDQALSPQFKGEPTNVEVKHKIAIRKP